MPAIQILLAISAMKLSYVTILVVFLCSVFYSIEFALNSKEGFIFPFLYVARLLFHYPQYLNSYKFGSHTGKPLNINGQYSKGLLVCCVKNSLTACGHLFNFYARNNFITEGFSLTYSLDVSDLAFQLKKVQI